MPTKRETSNPSERTYCIYRARLARFLKPPKRKRGEKFSKDESNDRAKKAATDVLFIKKLWRQEFPAITDVQGDLVTAEPIAADRNKVSIEAIESKLKNLSRK